MKRKKVLNIESCLTYTPVPKNNIVSFPSPVPSVPSAPKKNRNLNTDRLTKTKPIKDINQLDAVKEQLLYHFPKYGIRNYIIFCLGIHIGIRAGDLLTLRLKDIYDFKTRTVNTTFILKEEKTGKTNSVSLAPEVVEMISQYIQDLPDQSPDAPLFPSRKKQPKTTARSQKLLERGRDATGCLDVSSYGRILREIGNIVGIPHLCTHSMRKTYGYHFLTTWKNELIHGEIPASLYLQHHYNHCSMHETFSYIDISTDIDEAVARKQIF